MAGHIYYPNKYYIVEFKIPGVAPEDPQMYLYRIRLDSDLGLVVAERPKITPPEVKTEYVDILGRDGQLDLTGAVDGNIHFNDTEIQIKCLVLPDVDAQYVQDILVSSLLGRRLVITIEEINGKPKLDGKDPESARQYKRAFGHGGGADGLGWSNIGRVLGIEPEYDEHFSYITINYRCSAAYHAQYLSEELEGEEKDYIIPYYAFREGGKQELLKHTQQTIHSYNQV